METFELDVVLFLYEMYMVCFRFHFDHPTDKERSLS